jgi:hypothetical protein
MSLTYIGNQLVIYGGLTCLIGGLLGNSLNVFIFSTDRNYRRNPCTFYFMAASIANIIYMSINFTGRIVGVIVGIDFTTTSVGWCKMRQYFIVAFSLITLTCSCLAAIDQFFITSRNVLLRRLSKIESAHRIVMIIVIIWFLHAIPSPIYYNIVPPSNRCVITNSVFAVYNRVYLLGLLCFIPISVTSIFGYLTYRNIRQTRVLAEQNANRQLTRMTLFQVVFVAICLIPYSINSVYGYATEKFVKDSNQLTKENFATTVAILVTYVYYSVCLVFFLFIEFHTIFNYHFREVATYF